jgi:hypothetical protein
VILLARSAKNRVLWTLPAATVRQNRKYGERAPTSRHLASAARLAVAESAGALKSPTAS